MIKIQSKRGTFGWKLIGVPWMELINIQGCFSSGADGSAAYLPLLCRLTEVGTITLVAHYCHPNQATPQQVSGTAACTLASPRGGSLQSTQLHLPTVPKPAGGPRAFNGDGPGRRTAEQQEEILTDQTENTRRSCGRGVSQEHTSCLDRPFKKKPPVLK